MNNIICHITLSKITISLFTVQVENWKLYVYHQMITETFTKISWKYFKMSVMETLQEYYESSYIHVGKEGNSLIVQWRPLHKVLMPNFPSGSRELG